MMKATNFSERGATARALAAARPWALVWQGLAAAILVVVASGCAGEPPNRSAGVARIERAEGEKYYVGGPVYAVDKFGRLRPMRYSGEVLLPPSRGHVVGFTPQSDGTWQRREWINGELRLRSTGDTDGEKILRELYRETFREGRVHTKVSLEYNDEAREVRRATKEFDPETGDFTKTYTLIQPYTLPFDDDDSEDDPEEASEDEELEAGEETDEPTEGVAP
jgi:hypothetical protein